MIISNVKKGNFNKYEAYLLANGMILIILLLMIIYPFLNFRFNLWISCQYKILYGTECRSCGLTRGLWSCIKFDFLTANKYNPQSVFVFFSIIGQLMFRFFLVYIFNFSNNIKPRNIKPILIIDILLISMIIITNIICYG